MALDHRCPDTYRVEPACHYLAHNDGSPNTAEQWHAWIAAARPHTSTMQLCDGIWDAPSTITLDISGLIFEGRHRGVAQIVSREPSGALLRLANCGDTRLRNFYLKSAPGLTPIIGLWVGVEPGFPSSVNYLDGLGIDVHAKVAAVELYRTGDGRMSNCHIHQRNVPTSILAPDRLGKGVSPGSLAQAPALKATEMGHWLLDHNEVHQWADATNAVEVYGLAGSLVFDGNYLANSGQPGGGAGLSHVRMFGEVVLLSFTGTIFGSETGQAPSFTFYADGAMRGLSTRSVSAAPSFAVLGMTLTGSDEGFQWHGGVSGGASLLIAHPDPARCVPIQAASVQAYAA